MSSATRVLSHVVRSRELAVAVVLVALVVVTTLKNDNFLFSPDGWRNLLLNPSMLLILAVGQTAVIITRNVDLSVGATLGLTAYAVGKLYTTYPDLPVVAWSSVGCSAWSTGCWSPSARCPRW